MKSFALTLSPPSDIGEETFENICNLFDSFSWPWIGCRENASKWHAHFGVLAPYNDASAFGKRIRNLMKEFDPEEYKLPTVAIKVKTWYVGGPGYEPKIDNYNETVDTWEKYLEKDGLVRRGQHWEYTEDTWATMREQVLTPNKPPGEQREKVTWGAMQHWAKMFEDLKLPTATTEDIQMGLSNICFYHKLDKMPERRKWNELRDCLWMYINNYKGDAFTFCENMDLAQNLRKKRKLEDIVADEWHQKLNMLASEFAGQ